MNNYLKSPLNYTGGKYKLLPQILPLFPQNINTFWDIFCGGANVGINVPAKKTIYNDNNTLLMHLYSVFAKYDTEKLILKIQRIIKKYNLSESSTYGYSYYDCNSSKGLAPYNKDKFIQLKEDFNHRKRKDDTYFVMLYVLIIYGFNNQIRFNSNGEYNLPVGKRDFNNSIKSHLVKFMEKLQSQNKEFRSIPFSQIDINEISANDFVYCDPPYLITTASYNELNGWTEEDEKNLLHYLDALNNNSISFALSNVTMHKGKENSLLIKWAKKYNIHNLNFDYNNSNYHGKNTEKHTQEVLITNF